MGQQHLDGDTTPPEVQVLQVGQAYEIDGVIGRYGGTAHVTAGVWLRLQLRDGIVLRPVDAAARMIPVDARRLSSCRESIRAARRRALAGT